MTTMNGTVSIVIMGVPNAGHMLIDVKTSESVSSNKPMLHFNYTLVDSISLSGPSSTDADTGVQFSGSLLDATGSTLSGDVLWSSTAGSIDATGFFTPYESGIVTITASYGQVAESVNITVNAGNPTIVAQHLKTGACRRYAHSTGVLEPVSNTHLTLTTLCSL